MGLRIRILGSGGLGLGGRRLAGRSDGEAARQLQQPRGPMNQLIARARAGQRRKRDMNHRLLPKVQERHESRLLRGHTRVEDAARRVLAERA